MMHNGLRIEYKKGDYKRALLGIILIIAALLGTTAAYLAMAATFGRNPALFAVEVYQHYFRYSRCAESYPEIGSPAGWVWDLGYRDGVEDCALVNVMSGSVHSLPILSVSRLSHTELESMRKIIEGKVPIRKDCVLIKCLDVKDVEYFLTTCILICRSRRLLR